MKRLLFGAKSSPEIFHRLTQAVRRTMAKRRFVNIIVYLDDFLVITAMQAECTCAYEVLLQLLQDLGFTINQSKIVPPMCKLTFLGFDLDTVSCSMALPQEKLNECQTIVSSFMHKRRASKNQLLRLPGKLNWACIVIYGGRTFLRRILDGRREFPFPWRKHRLTPSFYRNITWWVHFLQVFNRKQFFLHE